LDVLLLNSTKPDKAALEKEVESFHVVGGAQTSKQKVAQTCRGESLC